MSKLTYQQRGSQSPRIPVSQRRTAGGKTLEDNRAAFAAKPLKQGETAQRVEDEEELLKEKSGTAQRAKDGDEETVQAKFSDQASLVQRVEQPAKPNNTGLPDKLKTSIESLSGMSMDSVNVHYNSAKPAQMNALAYAQGTDIHVGPGQEKHLPHEAWHVVQQAQGRVRPTMQMKNGVPVNNDKSLECEADVMGGNAAQMRARFRNANFGNRSSSIAAPHSIQLKSITVGTGSKKTQVEWDTNSLKGSSDKVGVKMDAKNLIADNVDEGELIGSTPKTSAQKDLMSKMPTQPSLSSTSKFIKGHLLNHNIGGPGLDFNMFPITGSANSAHCRFVETSIKTWVLKNKNPVDYLVQVDINEDKSDKQNKTGYVNATFKCRATNKATDEKIQTDVQSIYGSKAIVKEADTIDIEEPSDETVDFEENSWLQRVYNNVMETTDSNEVEELFDKYSAEVGEYIANKYNDDDQDAIGVVDEILKVKTKRLTSPRQALVQDIVKEGLLIFVLFNDKSSTSEFKTEYPSLFAMLNAPPQLT